VLLGDGTGGFSTATNFPVGISPASVTIGDFNEDGKLDLATANTVAKNVSVLLGNGTGGFSTAANFGIGIGNTPVSSTTGDFNGDGNLDLVTGNFNSFNSNSVSILLGNGMGGFNIAIDFPVGWAPTSVTTGDFNGDGKLDLVTANFNSNSVSVLLNTCNPDTDGDTVPDSTDNCPLNANPDQLDTDSDGIGNVCDSDDDNDGVADAADNCPLTSNPSQSDFDLDGIGDTCDPQTGPPRNKEQCKNGGYARFDFPRTFRNQGDCIQFVNTGR